MRLSSRAESALESETLKIAAEIHRLRAAGKEVVSLLEGEPDLPPPAPVVDAVARALREGRTRYSPSAGLPELKTRIAAKLRARNGVRRGPDEILVTNGAKQAIYTALQTLCGPGDEVVILAPYWVTFPEAVKLAGASPVVVETGEGGRLDPGRVARALTRRTRAILINTPNNPTGAVYSREELRELLRLAARRGAALISDEAYEDLVYDGAAHVSPASLPGGEGVVTIQTFSKSWSMTGFRVGYLAAPPALARAAARIHGHVTGNVCTFAQAGAAAALALDDAELQRRRKVFERRRDLAWSLAAPHFGGVKPRGAYYLFLDARRHLGRGRKDSRALAGLLLERAGVAVVPGSSCGREGFLRVSFSSSEKNVRRGMTRIAEALRR